MGIFKSFTDMAEMISAAPGLLQSANQLAATAKAQGADQPGFGQAYVNGVNEQNAPVAGPGMLEPIAGVSLEQYCLVSKGIAAYGYDASALPRVAQTHGIAPEAWSEAQAGWGARVQADRAVGARFNALYTAN